MPCLRKFEHFCEEKEKDAFREVCYNKNGIVQKPPSKPSQEECLFWAFFHCTRKESIMQKTFIKYTVMIMTSAIFLILFINFLFSRHNLETQQFNTFRAKIEQVIHTLESNRMELELVKKNLDEDYLTRAKAAAYVMDRQEDVVTDVSMMQYLAELLNVDELHVIDENGIIISSSVSKYVGFDMKAGDQTRPFLVLLEDDDKSSYLIQEPQPNAAEGKIMQYVGVVRRLQKGFVQVGFVPERQMEAQSRNTYNYIFSMFPTDVEEEFFVVDCNTGVVLGHSDNMDHDFTEDCYQLEQLLGCTKGAYKTGKNGKKMYIVSRNYDDVLICAALPGEVLSQKLMENTFHTFFYLLFIEAAVILLLYYLVKSKVIDGIHHIIDRLSAITDGNLDTIVDVGGNREFEELSGGINAMVRSIINISDRISAIIDISGIPLAAFEYGNDKETVFATSGIGKLLEIPTEKVTELCRNMDSFDRYIGWITRNPVEGEEDVYQLNDTKYVRIHMSQSQEGKLGVITDVTTDMMEKARMRYENTHDALTRLYKYRHFQQLAQDILQNMPEGKVCAAVMLDLDYFKGINDTFGHDMGDKYLQSFAAVLNALPSEHFLTSRRSGDEFCMMIYNCDDRTEIIQHLEAFYEALEKNQVVLSDTETRTISTSAGFAWTADSSEEILTLLSHADEALYEIKKATKGTYGEY